MDPDALIDTPAPDAEARPAVTRRYLLRAGLALPPLFLLAACAGGQGATAPTALATATTAPTSKPAAPAASSPAAAPPPATAAPPAATSAPAGAAKPASSPATEPAAANAAASPAAGGGCVLTPQQTEGPYYLEKGLVRSDITEGRPGTPLRLELTVQNAARCQPISGATVEVWQCDALGEYSGFSAASPGAAAKPSGPAPGGTPGGQQPTNTLTFLRGGQVTDASGRVTFQTVYPGWYQGRTVHIHVKVKASGPAVHTGQLYFDDAISTAVFTQAPYAARPNRDTTNARDGIFQQGGQQSLLALTQAGSGYTGTKTLTVQV